VGPADSSVYLRQSGNDPLVIAAQDGISPKEGKHMMKAYLNRKTSPVNYRTEVSLKSPEAFEKGKEYWLGISVFVPKNWNMNYGSKSNGMVWQWHGRPFDSPDGSWRNIQPIVLWHTADGWRVNNVNYPTRSPNKELGLGNMKDFLGMAPYKLGQWNDFVINVKFSGSISPNDTNGFVKVWINGSKIVDVSGQNYFGEEPQGPYFKFGLYHAYWKSQSTWTGPDDRVLYYDSLRVGDANSSYEEVLGTRSSATTIAPPSPPSSISAE
jgi:hypothetical protein